MNVKVELTSNIQEPCMVIYTNKITEEITALLRLIENQNQKDFIILQQEERYIVVKLQDIYMVRLEGKLVIIYGKTEKYYSKLRLYEVEEQLGSDFMQISKTTLINRKQIESVEPSFSGTMYLKLKNQSKDYISRKYLPDFKKYLGI